MLMRIATLQECLPLIKTAWPDSYHILPIDNSFGLVKWKASDLTNADPKFYVIEIEQKIVACLHVFYASSDVLCIRTISGTASLEQWQALFNIALSNSLNVKKVYIVFKESINTLVKDLGFNDIQGPFWTYDWKVLLAWKTV
jgi:N-acetylglutamate synthase-like GNAT family acetyltransferase